MERKLEEKIREGRNKGAMELGGEAEALLNRAVIIGLIENVPCFLGNKT